MQIVIGSLYNNSKWEETRPNIFGKNSPPMCQLKYLQFFFVCFVLLLIIVGLIFQSKLTYAPPGSLEDMLTRSNFTEYHSKCSLVRYTSLGGKKVIYAPNVKYSLQKLLQIPHSPNSVIFLTTNYEIKWMGLKK